MSDKKKKILVINCLVLVGLIGIITAFSLSFKELYRKEKIETLDVAINNNDVTTVFVLVKK